MNKQWYLKQDESAVVLTLHKDELDAEILEFTESELEEMLYTLRNPSNADKLTVVIT